MTQRETKTYCKPRGELGEAKASVRKGSMNFAVLGSRFHLRYCPLLYHRQLTDGFKAQTHCLRLGGLTPKASLGYE
jgi:hypothetical protein